MQAIRVKYYGPTNTKSSRFIASCESRKVTVSYDHNLSLFDNYWQAAQTLIDLMDWNDRKWQYGTFKNVAYFVPTFR
jgi:hypothetical protein